MAIIAARYRPKFQQQLVSSDKYGRYNCTAYSLAMGVDATTLGAVVVTGKYVRAISSEPVPDPQSPGLNLRQIIEVSRELRVPFVDHSGKSFSFMMARADEGYVQVLQGDSGVLVPKYQKNKFDGPHAVLVTGVSPGSLLVWNPLNKIEVWVPKAIMAKYAAGTPDGTGIRFAGATHKMPDIAVKVTK